MKIYQGDIVWVTFPFTDGVRLKERPALVLSNDQYNKHSEDILLAYITSQKKDSYQISLEQSYISEGRLPKTSYIRYDKILLVEKSRILGVIAIVRKEFYNEVASKICEFISSALNVNYMNRKNSG